MDVYFIILKKLLFLAYNFTQTWDRQEGFGTKPLLVKRCPGRMFMTFNLSRMLWYLPVGSKECFLPLQKSSKNAEMCLVRNLSHTLWHFLWNLNFHRINQAGNTKFRNLKWLGFLCLGKFLSGITYERPRFFLLSSSKHLMDNIVNKNSSSAACCLKTKTQETSAGWKGKAALFRTDVQRPSLKFQTKQKSFKSGGIRK